MGISVHIDIDREYQALYARRAGFLPADRRSLHRWHRWLDREVEAGREGRRKKKRSPSVVALAKLIENDGIVRMYVDEMLQQQCLLRDPEGQPIPPKSVIKDVPQMLAKLDFIVNYAPWWSDASHFPMSALFVYVMMTPAGESVFRNDAFNDALRAILQEWCDYLTSRKSLNVVTTETKPREGWLSLEAYEGMKLWEFELGSFKTKHWGFKSYNGYFHRNILKEVTPDQIPPEPYLAVWKKNTKVGDIPRPIAAPDDPKVIVSANDGQVWKIARKVKREAKFWLKGQPYSLQNMLDGEYVERFVGGSVFQSFLSGANFHRWHAPIDGVVKCARVVNGLMFSDAESAGWDTSAGTESQGYEASVNTRGLVFIESPHRSIGLVCVIPIGITEISSVVISVAVGQSVKKGDELGYFNYGGSTLALVFEPGKIKRFTRRKDDLIDVNAQIALTR